MTDDSLNGDDVELPAPNSCRALLWHLLVIQLIIVLMH